MTEAQIKHMVDRFLNWKLPDGFNPDGGISFQKTFNEHTAHPMKHEPSGTNLFNATQADAMVRHMLEGLASPPEPLVPAGVDAATVERCITVALQNRQGLNIHWDEACDRIARKLRALLPEKGG